MPNYKIRFDAKVTPVEETTLSDGVTKILSPMSVLINPYTGGKVGELGASSETNEASDYAAQGDFRFFALQNYKVVSIKTLNELSQDMVNSTVKFMYVKLRSSTMGLTIKFSNIGVAALLNPGDFCVIPCAFDPQGITFDSGALGTDYAYIDMLLQMENPD